MELVSEILSIQVEYWMARLGSTEALRMRKRLNDAFRHSIHSLVIIYLNLTLFQRTSRSS